MAKQKQLVCREEEFFVYCALVFGKPDMSKVVKHIGKSGYRLDRGILPWLHETHEGQLFTHCVTSMGEAKSRARNLFVRYYYWYQKPQEKQLGNIQHKAPHTHRKRTAKNRAGV